MMRSVILCCAMAMLARAADIAGKWEVTASSPGGRERRAELVLTEQGGRLSGTIAAESGSTALQDVQLSGDRLSFKVQAGEGSYAIQFTVVEGALKGTYAAPDGRSGSISAKRSAAAPTGSGGVAGSWKVTAVSGSGREYKLVLTIREEAGKLSGALGRNDGTVPLEDVALAGSELSFKLRVDSGTYTIRLTLADGTLKGGYRGAGGETGTVTAVR